MGKHLITSEESTAEIQEVNQGCMWGMFHILDYHRWGVKRVFHYKKKRHARCKQFHTTPCFFFYFITLFFVFIYLFNNHYHCFIIIKSVSLHNKNIYKGTI